LRVPVAGLLGVGNPGDPLLLYVPPWIGFLLMSTVAAISMVVLRRPVRRDRLRRIRCRIGAQLTVGVTAASAVVGGSPGGCPGRLLAICGHMSLGRRLDVVVPRHTTASPARRTWRLFIGHSSCSSGAASASAPGWLAQAVPFCWYPS
jgi:hypothetical protein